MLAVLDLVDYGFLFLLAFATVGSVALRVAALLRQVQKELLRQVQKDQQAHLARLEQKVDMLLSRAGLLDVEQNPPPPGEPGTRA